MNLQLIELQIIEIGVLILAAYMGGLLARKLRIGEVIGQIAGGILVGPHFLSIVRHLIQTQTFLKTIGWFTPIEHFVVSIYPKYTEVFHGASFFTFVYLGLITFALGEELHLHRVKQIGGKAAVITIAQAVLTLVLVVFGFWTILGFPLILALIMGSIGIATAPALSFVLMNRLKIEGTMRNVLSNVIVIDDLIEVVLFSVFLGIAGYMSRPGDVFNSIILWKTSKELIFTLVVGMVIFAVLWFLIKVRRNIRKEDIEDSDSFLYAVMSNHPTPSVEIMFIVVGVIAISIGFCMHFHLPFMLATITAGFLISNYHSHAVFDSLKIKNVMPIFNLFFFALIGASIRIELISFKTLHFALIYIILRTIGKYGGTWLACKYCKLDPKVTATLPRLMLPQAELAAIEVLLVANLLPGSPFVDDMVNTIVVSLLVFQVFGAWLSENTLIRWKNWITGEQEALDSAAHNPEISTFKELLKNNVIGFDASGKNSVIENLSNYLYSKKLIDDKSEIIDAVLERELLMSTAIGNGIAIPHCRMQSVKESAVVCALLTTPVDWGAPDKKPVDLVFLIVTPIENPEIYLSNLRTISTTLKATRFRDEVRVAFYENRVEAYLRQLN